MLVGTLSVLESFAKTVQIIFSDQWQLGVGAS